MSAKKFLVPSLLVCTTLALALRVLAKPTLAKPAAPSASYDAVDAYVAQQMRRLNIPGVSLAIVEGDQVVHLQGFGQARPGGEPPSPQTPFVLGSLTKSFTALAVMQLVESGKVELDAPVQRYLPWFHVADLQASAQMTVRHLLNQTSGLPQLPGLLPLADFDSRPGATVRQAQALATLKLTRPAGAAFEYSNLNYNLLGLVIEAASDETYADYIQRHIFTPLGMRHSYTAQAEAKRNGLAVGHRYWFGHPFPVPELPIPSGSLPSGQLISSAEDMAHYLIAQLNEGRYGGTQILSGAGIGELHRGVAEANEMGISMGKYGMGWFITAPGQGSIAWHNGIVPDFASYMALLPEQKKGVVLLINANHGMLTPVLVEMGMGVAALLAGKQPEAGQPSCIPWLLRAPLLIPLLQIAGAAATLGLLRRWRREPERRPGPGRTWGQYILLPLVPNLAVALALIPMLGSLRGFMQLFMPDLAWLALACGSFSLAWSFLRTGLILGTLRGQSAAQPWRGGLSPRRSTPS